MHPPYRFASSSSGRNLKAELWTGNISMGQCLSLPYAWWLFSPVKITPPCLHLPNTSLHTCISPHFTLPQQRAGSGISFINACFSIPGGKSLCKLQGWPSENEALNYSSLVFIFRFTIWWEDKLYRLIRKPWNSVHHCAMQSQMQLAFRTLNMLTCSLFCMPALWHLHHNKGAGGGDGWSSQANQEKQPAKLSAF